MKAILRLLFIFPLLLGLDAQAGAIRNLPGFTVNTFGGNDDGSFPCTGPDVGVPFGCTPGTVPIGFTINFYGASFDSLYVNNNGNVSFDAEMSDYTPFELSGSDVKTIAAFFADVDTRVGNIVTFGNDTVDGHQAFGVNWSGVGYYSEEVDKLNNFQIILINRPDRNPGDFDIEFNYDKVQWESGDASGGTDGLGGESVIVGYSDGTGNPGTSFQLNGSGIPGRLIDLNPGGLVHGSLNTNVPGRYVFPIINLPDTQLAVTRLSQGDPRWATNAYDNSGTNLQSRGSAISCLAMGLSYAGVATDPGALNHLLISSNDFAGNNNLNWDAATRDASHGTLEFHGFRTSDAQYLNQKLSQGIPVIVGVNLNHNGDPQHYVVVTGKQGGQFLISDPGQANATTLDAFTNTFETRGYVGDPPGNIGGLDISVADAADLLVVDPLGRLTGFDPAFRGVVEAIPQSVHFSDALEAADQTGTPGTNTAHQVEIYQPLPGRYQIFLVGSNSGPYQLTLRAWSSNGVPDAPLTFSGTHIANSITSFQVSLGTLAVTAKTFTNQAPWSVTPTSGSQPMSVTFSGPTLDSAGLTLTNWFWDLGDGTFSTNKSPMHNYFSAGVFFPSLSALNNTGGTAYSLGSALVVTDSFVGGLVQNGGFETGDFTGWNGSGDVSFAFVDSQFAFSGSFGANLETFGSTGFFSQDLATTPGALYILSFWLHSDDFPNEFSMSWNGGTLMDQRNIGNVGWTNVQFQVTATAATTPLQFGFLNDDTAVGLDDISVLPVTFHITSISPSGSNLVFNVNSQFASGTYVTLVSTNAAQPVSQWTPVATNTVATSGSFSFTLTNTISRTVPRRYYTLRKQ